MPENTHRLPLHSFSLWRDGTSIGRRWHIFEFCAFFLLKIFLNICVHVFWQFSKFMLIHMFTFGFALSTFRLLESWFHDENSHTVSSSKKVQRSGPNLYEGVSSSVVYSNRSQEVPKSRISRMQSETTNLQSHEDDISMQEYSQRSISNLYNEEGGSSSVALTNVNNLAEETLKYPSVKTENGTMNFEIYNAHHKNELSGSHQRPLLAGEEGVRSFYARDLENWRTKTSQLESNVTGLEIQRSLSKIIRIERFSRPPTAEELSILEHGYSEMETGTKRSPSSFSGEECEKPNLGRRFVNLQTQTLEVSSKKDALDNHKSDNEVLSITSFAGKREKSIGIQQSLESLQDQTPKLVINLEDVLSINEIVPLESFKRSSPVGREQERSIIARAIADLKIANIFVEESESRI